MGSHPPDVQMDSYEYKDAGYRLSKSGRGRSMYTANVKLSFVKSNYGRMLVLQIELFVHLVPVKQM